MDPIITSLLDVDFYKFTMGQFVFLRYPDVLVRSAFRNRTKDVNLGNVLDMGELKEELDHARTLRFTNSDLHYLRGTNEYGERMFQEPYLEFLKGLRLPEYRLERRGDDIILEFEGRWAEQIYWETIGLSIVDELYTRKLMQRLTRFEQDAVYATGRIRLMEKIKTLRKHPDLRFSDFGTRRRFSGAWQAYVVEALAEELPDQLLGTSNTFLANRCGLLPMGTNAHELPMVVAGLRDDGERDDWLHIAQDEVLTGWWDLYGEGLSIFLPDTFGTDFFLERLSRDDLAYWKGFRQDSGDPAEEGEKYIARYHALGMSASKKMVIFSDGLDVGAMVSLYQRFNGRIIPSFGWGTNATNDLFHNAWHDGLWYGPLSLVVKPVSANGRGLVKLSNNLAKATGRPEDVERYKRAATYTNAERVECVY